MVLKKLVVFLNIFGIILFWPSNICEVSAANMPPECPEKCRCFNQLKYIHCENINLRFIPNNLPETAVELYLSHNLITSIQDNAFINLKNLTTLSLKQNNIVKIEPSAFAGLSNLKSLFLTNNQLTELPRGVFTGLEQASHVFLSQNHLKTIPDLGTLPNLTRVNLDTNNLQSASFPSGFSNLVSLQAVVLSNNPNIGEIHKKDLEPLYNLPITKIALNRCGLSFIENDTFSGFERLRSVGLGYNNLNGSVLRNIINGFRGSKITALDLSHVVQDGVLPNDAFRGLEGVPLKSLILQQSNINTIQNGTFRYLVSLEYLNLIACKIVTFQDGAFTGLSKLKRFYISSNDLKTFPTGNLPSVEIIDMSHNRNIQEVPENVFIFMRMLKTLKMRDCEISVISKRAFTGAEELNEVDLSLNKIGGKSISTAVFSDLANLKILNLDSNNMGNIDSEAELFQGLGALENLSMADNDCSILNNKIFQPLKKLKKLDLRRNDLGAVITNDAEGELFSGFGALEELDLSNQVKLVSLPGKLLHHSPHLKTLHLDRNTISHWGQALFDKSPALRFINLTLNHISLINQSSGFDSLANDTKIDLSNNPFNCFCDLRWFRNWLNTTRLTFVNMDKYRCNAPADMAGQLLHNFNTMAIEEQCRPPPWLVILLGSLGGLTLIILVIFSLIYRYRWPLRLRWYYMRHHFHRQEAGRDYAPIAGDDVKYDAFVSASDNIQEQDWVRNELLPRIDNGRALANEDEDEEDDELDFKGRHALCYEPVHLTEVGRSIYAVVGEAVDASRKVIVVLSDDYLRSGQKREFELQLALHKATEQGFHTLILVLLSPDVAFHIPADLLVKMERHEELEWTPADPAGQEVFWQRLQQQLDFEGDRKFHRPGRVQV